MQDKTTELSFINQLLQPILIFLGPPGSGKGTQARMAAEKYGLMYLGCGDILREKAKENSDEARRMKEHMKKGDLIPDELVSKIFIEEFKKVLSSGIGAALDGYPRNVKQAEELDQAIGEFKNAFSKVIFIELDRETAADRMLKRKICTRCKQSIPYSEETKDLRRCPQCGGELVIRADDTPETVAERRRIYETETAPVISYYEDRVLRVDGKPEIGDIFGEIVKFIISPPSKGGVPPRGGEILYETNYQIQTRNRNYARGRKNPC